MNYGLSELSYRGRSSMRSNTFPLGLISVLGAVIALAIAYALMLPALTSSSTVYCGADEHVHGEDCLTQTLICGYPEEDIPVENNIHQHGDECYVVEKVLVCTMPEVSSVPDGGAGADQALDMLSGDAKPAEDGSLQNPQNEAEGLVAVVNAPETPTGEIHVHDASCYEETLTLICDLPESEEKTEGQLAEEVGSEAPHVHSDACYESECTCDLEEHKHSLQCFSNPSADLESATDWKSTLPAEDSLTGVWADDLIAVATSQLGYSESTQNYVVVDGDKTKGYTRYGEWYGDAYGDWCAMFVSFCLNYAGIPADSVPRDSNCQNWIEQLAGKNYSMFYSVGAYAEDGVEPFEPIPGDLIFFDWNSDAISDHVGIVAEVMESKDGVPARVKTIEGNSSNVVQYREYEIDDASIMGYASLPINTGEEAVTLDAGPYVSQVDEAVSTYGAQEGDLLYHVGNWTYQASWHKVNKGMVRTFALVPVPEGYDDRSDFTPQNWTAKSDANYVVTYCVDENTSNATKFADYTTFKLDNSRFPEATRQRLAAIVMHAYPFITAEEMRSQMLAAGVVGVEGCGESEFTAAAQQAIWKIANPTSALEGSEYPSAASSYERVSVNPLKESDINHKHGEHVSLISDYLLKLTPLTDPEVDDWDAYYELTDDGLYNLTVKVMLKREVYPEENVTVQLVAGEKYSQPVKVTKGEDSFILSIEALTAEELLDSEASILVEGARPQAYFYESDTYQDMIGGSWEAFRHDLSFAVGSSDELTSVSVSKVWADGDAGVESVQVSLLANGVEQGEQVYLSAKNDWKYTWDGLPKKDILNEKITYTVFEEPVEGYLSIVGPGDGAATGKMWQKLTDEENLVEGGEYVLVFTSSGALAWSESNTSGSNRFEWGYVNLGSTSSTPESAIWTAEKDASGSIYLKNKGRSADPYRTSYMYSSGSTVKFSNNKSPVSYSLPSESGNRYLEIGGKYFSALTMGGEGTMADSTDSALPLEIYRLEDAGPSLSDTSYVITNYKEDVASEPVEVSVEKRWVGDRNGEYPESATVFLLQNGKRYGEPVTLSEENGWSYTWEDLPSKYQSTSVEISYSIEEVDIEGYTSSVTAKANEPYSFVVTNTKNHIVGDFSIKKVSSRNTDRVLAGAVYDLYIVDEEAGAALPELGIEEPVIKFNTDPLVSGDGGIVNVNDIEIGSKCYLVETKAPNGYYLLSCPILFTVGGSADAPELTVVSGTPGQSWAFVDDETSDVLVVKNANGYALPEAGGIGVAPLMLTGALLLAGASFLLFRRRFGEKT